MLVQQTIAGLPAPRPLLLHETALFLDLDGTLAPLAARPQDVRPLARRTVLLDRLAGELGGRLAVVSGRTLKDIDRILEDRVAAVAAVHGLVRREPDGRICKVEPHPGLDVAIGGFQSFASDDPGLIVEVKSDVSVALHFRQAPRLAGAAKALARTLAAQTGLALQDGDMVQELRAPGPDKGDSVRAFMSQSPFVGAWPVFVGDDETDEKGFSAARDLGGIGVIVGSMRKTAAQFRLADVEAALRWLEAAS